MSPPPLPLDHHIFISKTTSNDSKLDPGRIDLLLGLALHTPTTTTTSHIEKQQQPSLTLNLLFPTQEQKLSSRDNNFDDVSSFSNSFVSVKREREEDATANNVVYEDDVSNIGSSCRKKKLRLNKQQSDLLEESFKLHTTLNPKQKEALARRLNLRPRQVEVWFQNRRARSKLKQTEVDCDFLKKSCEKLAEENEKLHKELQLLKSLNKKQQQQQPFYMHHLPPAQTSRLSTNFICPSCHHHHQQQVLPVSPNNNNSNFLISTKRLFFDPFTKAC